jgi:hypothetical protein
MKEGSWSRRGSWGRLGVLVGCLLAWGCGGGDDGSNLPPAPVRSLIQQGSWNLSSLSDAQDAGLPLDAGRTDFSTSGSGTLEVNVDWTFSSNAVGFGVYRGACTFTQWYADTCQQVDVRTLTNAKPARLTITSLPAGAYTLVIANGGPGAESGTYQIFLTR